MPLYKFENETTEEFLEVNLKYEQIEEFLSDLRSVNKDWNQVFTMNTVSGSKDAYAMSDDGWKETLQRIKSSSGKENTIETK